MVSFLATKADSVTRKFTLHVGSAYVHLNPFRPFFFFFFFFFFFDLEIYETNQDNNKRFYYYNLTENWSRVDRYFSYSILNQEGEGEGKII